MSKRFRFSKMHGLGNDFVVLDRLTQQIELSSEEIAELADRNTGIGFDQLLIVDPPDSPDADFRYRIYNASGGEVEHCGNGARCFVDFVHRFRLSANNPIIVETQKGTISLTAKGNSLVEVDMGQPSFEASDLPFIPNAQKEHPLSHSLPLNDTSVEVGIVSMGNPHAVMRVDDVATADIANLGPQIESHQQFPNNVNAGFMEIVSRGHIRLRVYERGAGETQACGTGACAAVAYGRQRGWLDAEVKVSLTGGDLWIHYDELDSHLLMTGPATHVYNGNITLHKK